MEHSLDVDVVDEAALTPQKPGVFLPYDRLSDQRLHAMTRCRTDVY